MTTRRRTRWRVPGRWSPLRLPTVAAVVALNLAACSNAGGSVARKSDPSGAGPSRSGQGSTERDVREAWVAFAQCMRDNGVEDFPDPDFSNGSMLPFDPDIFHGTDPASQAAFAACRDLLAGIGPGG